MAAAATTMASVAAPPPPRLPAEREAREREARSDQQRGRSMEGVLVASNSAAKREQEHEEEQEEEEEEERQHQHQQQQQQQLSLVALLLTAIRKSMVGCKAYRRDDVISAMQRHMDIGWPTDVRHIAHVTFDRFHGFLGLPVEFEVEIPGRVPSASASVFGVSPESMQCCYDAKGNSVPTILLLLQERLYSQGGLKAEGIFRINPENGQEELVRDQLNRGNVPDDIDVHCLAGLIKAWLRELPEGVLDTLSPEHVLGCNTEEQCVELVKRLPPTQFALLDWAVELMADVVEEEESNKMNARNIAMVFAPNMTQMSDPLTALVHAVQVMNLLKTLILVSLREREEAASGEAWSFSSSPTSEEEVVPLDHMGELLVEHDTDSDYENSETTRNIEEGGDEKVRNMLDEFEKEETSSDGGEMAMIILENDPRNQFQRSIEIGVIKCQ